LIKSVTIRCGFDCLCIRPIPERDRIVKLCVYHRNLVALDDFLGQVDIALQDIQVYERPKRR